MKNISELIKKHKKLVSLSIVLLIGVFFSLWLVKPGIINGHDMTFHLSRIKGLKDSILVGDYKALIHNALYGYGYANGLFYGNLLIYIPALADISGLNLINAYKVYILFTTIASAFTMYICIKNITKSRKTAILASFLYSACAYKAIDFIVRAAVGEMGAFVFLPLIILGFYEIVYGDYKKWWYFSIGFVGLIQCHLISTVLMAIIVVALLLVNYERLFKEKQRIKYLIISGVVGLLIGAYFVLPLLEGLLKNKMVVNLNSFPIWNYTVPFEKLFIGYPNYEWKDSPFLPSGIGILYIVLVLFRLKIKNTNNDKLLKFCDLSIVAAFVTLLCATDLFPWKELTMLQSVQFPWRLYLFSSLLFTVSSSIVVHYYLKNKTKKSKIVFIMIVVLVGLIPYISTEHYYRGHSNGGIFYDWNDYTVASGEYLPQGTVVNELKERGEVVTSNNDIQIEYTKEGNRIVVSYSKNNYKDTYIEVPLLYYYGYSAYDNLGNEYKIEKGNNNIIKINLINEEGNITVYYKGTLIQKLSYLLSLISIICFIIYLFIINIPINKKKNQKTQGDTQMKSNKLNDSFEKAFKALNIKDKNKQKLFIKIFKFVIVGGIATLISGIVFFICDHFFKMSVLLSNTIAFIISVVYNFWASCKYVFDVDKDKNKVRIFAEFIIFALLGYFLTQFLLWLMADVLKWNHMIAWLIATIIVMIFNFVTRQLFLEKRK